MSRFPDRPHLPRSAVTLLALGEDYAPLLVPPLAAQGVRVLACPANPAVDPRLRSHIDLSVLHLGGRRFVLAPYLRGSEFAAALNALGAEMLFAEGPFGPVYPADARLCALVLGERLFHAREVIDPVVRRAADGLRFVPVRQGYAKCAVCPVSETAAITADPGMAGVLRSEGCNVLQLMPGGVSLKGFSEGFFGGAAFLLAPDCLAFTGRADTLRDRETIEMFFGRFGIRTCSLTDFPLFDIGSCVLLSECERKNNFLGRTLSF